MREALERAEAIHAASPVREVIRVLNSLSNRTVATRLLTPDGLRPLRKLMEQGHEFSAMARIVYGVAMQEESGRIYSWKYVAMKLASRP